MRRSMVCLCLGGLACSADASALFEVRADPRIDAAFVGQPIWNDGRAEVAMYTATRGAGAEAQSIEVGTFVVAHRFDPGQASKAEGEAGLDSMKQAIFFEYEVGSEEFKTSYVINQTKVGLQPLKVSLGRFDWCSNQYRELAFGGGGRVRHLMRSDDYGNVDESRGAAGDFVFPQVWWLARAADLSKGAIEVEITTFDGKVVDAKLATTGTSTRTLDGETVEVEVRTLTYATPAVTLLGPGKSRAERFFVARDPARTLVGAEGDDYRMQLVQRVRSPYWSEDVWAAFRGRLARP